MPLPHTPTRSGAGMVGEIVVILVVYAAGLHNCNLATNVVPMLRWQETRGRPLRGRPRGSVVAQARPQPARPLLRRYPAAVASAGDERRVAVACCRAHCSH